MGPALLVAGSSRVASLVSDTHFHRPWVLYNRELAYSRSTLRHAVYRLRYLLSTDNAAADDLVAIVDYGRLAGSDGTDVFV